MYIINFTHPLTAFQAVALEHLIGQHIKRVIEVKTQLDPAQLFSGQVHTLIESIGLTDAEWQTLPLLINLPSHNVIAALVLAELHGRMGYFPAVIRLRPVANATPPQFEVAEIINLQAVRDRARQLR
ncbi:MAG: CRISPR-associated protein Csx15 [Acidobacteriota bacterium]|nr:CRISPR-associated protein Csx15 [Acidobacteriota bacterium]